jgi:hypothetical protein
VDYHRGSESLGGALRGEKAMTNFQLYIAVGLPTIAVIASLTISLVQISSIRDELGENMRELRSDIREIRGDIKLLTGKVYEMMAK